jgi:hypothetical protein
MRALHLYTGLFLAPWMTVYALSAFCLNHGSWFGGGSQWEVVREMEFSGGASFPQDPDEQADAILEELDLAGACRVSSDSATGELTITRLCAAGAYRITWQPDKSHLTVERQRPFSLVRLVHSLHFQRGYGYPGLAQRLWAITLDLTAISTLVWVISGVYLWARRPSKRLRGGIFLVAGIALFAWLVALLCQ